MTELGQRLKDARISKGLSYEELQEKTKIQKRYLQAIEEGEYGVLPGAFYARAFIKNYAEAVDLDPDELFEEHASDLPASDQGKTEYAPRSSRATRVPKDSKISRVLPLIFTVLLLSALLVAAYVFVSNNAGSIGSEPNKDNVDDFDSEQPEEPADESSPESNGNTGTDSEPEEEDGTETKSEEEEEPVQEQKLEQVSTEGIVTTYKLSDTKDFNVELKTTDNSYIDVKDSNNKFVQPGGKEFKKGETLTYDLADESEVTFNIGSTPAVSITVNGKPLTYTSDKVHQKIVIQFEKTSESQ
ncbi:helix-turn-helix domain-containing protein [Pseudalkalibacillus berkeleyi]|uniref:DUF4115 domain-containing protein n=1 Tax=Pseudalkalibacillus berkeleyi TaxID=1069813 RepID=A0ABS9GWK5_9BACL|nr:RodZ domain-containing protein [Pseudalkalibacillus berkeleyi]MCF6137177.1 DUF4115 domain-containing protein [Pseudalkalibacillus berkeleyi]